MHFESIILDINQLPISQQDMTPVPNANFIYQYTLKNPNTTQFAVIFNTTNPLAIQYQIWFNSSQTRNNTDVFGTNLLSIMRGLDEAIVATTNNQPTDLRIGLKDWPIIKAKLVSDNIVQSLGPTFFFCSVTIIFICTLNMIVGEKEKMLRHGMEVMGLKSEVYWYITK